MSTSGSCSTSAAAAEPGRGRGLASRGLVQNWRVASYSAVVFDLGGVLLDWDPRYLYRKLFDGDEAAMEQFLAQVCTPSWHAAQDLGYSIFQACSELAERHPGQADLIRAWGQRSEEMVGRADSGQRGDPG